MNSALRVSEERFRAIWDHATEAMALSDAQGTVLMANPAYFALYGYDPSEIIGRNFAVIYPPESRQGANRSYREIFEGETIPPPVETVVRRRDGTQRAVEVQVGFVTDGAGRRTAMINTIRDVTQRARVTAENARLFRELEDKSRQLEIASRHKSAFLANMSHEVRTPLNAIIGYTELVLDGVYGDVPDPLRDVLQRVSASGQHLLGLINSVLDLAKIEAGHLELALDDYSLCEIVYAAASQLASLAESKGLRLHVHVPQDLPIGRADERRLCQVLLNLVGNAIKFTDAGDITITAEEADGHFIVSVSDTGPGIPWADQERIFGEFQQADSATNDRGGAGLGLAIARSIIEMHGGRIWLDSALGEGSTFMFAIPIRPEPTEARDEAP